MSLLAAEFIQNKKRGETHKANEIRWFVDEFLKGKIPDYQMSAWLMAVCFQGLSNEELLELTYYMRDSGKKFDFKSKGLFTVDKHSTGGVGDKTSLIIGPLVAAAGVHVPMMAGRGLGHTGGTIDKLESYNGFDISLTPERFMEQVKNLGVAIIGQTDEICPADKRLYALRDVTSTVDSVELISASIMSKKLAEGLDGLAMDVKFGTGAFMKTEKEAEMLAQQIVAIGEASGVRVHAVISSMNQPLGRYSGNSLEVQECVDIMQNKKCVENGHDFYSDTRDLSVFLAAHMLVIGRKANTLEEARKMASKLLESGAAYEKYQAMCGAQGVKDFILPQPAHSLEIRSNRRGVRGGFDTESIGFALVQIGAGRLRRQDELDHTAGLEMHCRIGDVIQDGQLLYTLHGSDPGKLQSIHSKMMDTIHWSDRASGRDQLVFKVLEG